MLSMSVNHANSSEAWVNNQNFPPKKDPEDPTKTKNLVIGFDPISKLDIIRSI